MAPTSQTCKKRDRLSTLSRIVPPTQGTIFIAPLRCQPFRFSAQGDGGMTLANRRWLRTGDVDEYDYFQEDLERNVGECVGAFDLAAEDGPGGDGIVVDRPLVSQSRESRDFLGHDHGRYLADPPHSPEGVIDLTSDMEAASDVRAVSDIESEEFLREQVYPAHSEKAERTGASLVHRPVIADRRSEGFSEPSFASPRGGSKNAWTPGQEKALWQAQLKCGEGKDWKAVTDTVNRASPPGKEKSSKQCQDKWAATKKRVFGR